MSLYLLTSFITLIALTIATQNIKATSCTITKYDADDISKAQEECSEIILRGLTIPGGKTLDLTSLQNGTKVIFEGTTTWEYAEWKGPLLLVGGTDVEITGSSDHVLDGRGSLWWDGLGTGGGKRKPKLFRTRNLYDSRINNINIKNSPVHVFIITEVRNLTVENVTIDNRDGDTRGGHNSDGFDIGESENVVIKHSTVYNQDDCLAVKNGKNYEFSNNFCSGGHGISIGSVTSVTVDDVYISNCYVENSANGVRIKTVYGAVGSVTNITFENIVMKDITDYGIIIEGDYLNGGPTGIPTGGVPITYLNLRNISGTVEESGTNVYVLVESASNWNWSEIDVTGGKRIKECKGVPPESGISC